jgi:hypothetical protein
MICVNPRHYPTPEPPSRLTADPRLHVVDDTPCCDSVPVGEKRP